MNVRSMAGPCLGTLLFIACGSSDQPQGGPDGGERDSPVDVRIHDRAPPKDASKADVARDTAPPPPPCGSAPWTTYGHDAQRTFASDACTKGPLKTLWRYTPTAPTGRTFEAVFHAIAEVDGIFLQWMASDAPYTGTTAADRVSTAGKRVWTFDSGTDSNFGNWLTRWNDVLVLADDGMYVLDAAAGTQTHTTGVDW